MSEVSSESHHASSMMTDCSMNYVRLDVGGHLFMTHKSTLMRYEDSMLAKLVAPENDTRKSSDEFIKIDRDGKLFGRMLSYLRDDCSLDFDSVTDKDLKELCSEADYYNLINIVELCQAELIHRADNLSIYQPKIILTKHQTKFPLYSDFSGLFEYLKERQATAVVVNIIHLTRHDWFNTIKIQDIATLCFPVPLYCFSHIFPENNLVHGLSIFHKENFVYPDQVDQFQINFELSQGRFLKFLIKLRENFIKYD